MPRAKIKSADTSKVERYLEFIGSVHLSGLGMDEATFKIDRAAYAAFVPKAEKNLAEISGRHEVINRHPNSFVVVGHYEVSVKGDSDQVLVSLRCRYSALFALDKEAEEEFIERFAQNEARLVFWPYLRHFISDSTYRMSITPLRLPLSSEFLDSKT